MTLMRAKNTPNLKLKNRFRMLSTKNFPVMFKTRSCKKECLYRLIKASMARTTEPHRTKRRWSRQLVITAPASLIDASQSVSLRMSQARGWRLALLASAWSSTKIRSNFGPQLSVHSFKEPHLRPSKKVNLAANRSTKRAVITRKRNPKTEPANSLINISHYMTFYA